MQPCSSLLFLVYLAISHAVIATDFEPQICEPPVLSTFSMVQRPQRGSKYRPPGAPLDVEGYPVAPPELELKQVHVYVRHGERTPVSARMAEPPASIPERWLLCKQARRFRAAVAGKVSEEDERPELEVNRMLERPDGTSIEGECLLGELTDVGRNSTYNFGVALRKLYINKLKFLPDWLIDPSDVYFRSTNMPRTTESLQQAIHGLYPMTKCHPSIAHEVRIRNGREENLIGNTLACKRLEVLLVNFATAAASAYNPTLEPLDKKISKYFGGNAIRIDGKPRASGILDTIRASMAHGIKVPPEFEERSVTSTIEKAVANEWFSGYKTEEVRRLGMGRLLTDLSRKMHMKAKETASTPASERAPKILLHSTHDTALAALTNTLDVFDDRWPGFTASITVELFRYTDQLSQEAAVTSANMPVQPPLPQHPGILQSVLTSPFRRKTTTSDFFVRMRYQNRNLVLPLCADEGKHLPGSPEFCTLQAFGERVAELTPKDWEAECAV